MGSRLIRSSTIVIPVEEKGAQLKATFQVPGNAKRLVGVIVSVKTKTPGTFKALRHVFFALPAETDAVPFSALLSAGANFDANWTDKAYDSSFTHNIFNLGTTAMHLFYACPVQHGIPTLEINGTSGGFEDAILVTGVDDHASIQDYYLFRSTEKWTGVVDVNIY